MHKCPRLSKINAGKNFTSNSAQYYTMLNLQFNNSTLDMHTSQNIGLTLKCT